MNTNGRSVRLFLVDGTPTGLITAEIMNWTGHVLVAPRSRLADVLARPEAARTGVYFLYGNDPATPSRQRVYIGESDNVGSRIGSHGNTTGKDFWTNLCIVTSKDTNLTKGHVRFLESRIIEMAKLYDRATVDNVNGPQFKLLPESDIADMEYFVAQIGTILPVVGLDFLRPLPTHLPVVTAVDVQPDVIAPPAHSVELVLEDGKYGVHAEALEADGEITVRKGSTARIAGGTAGYSYKSLRDEIISDGRLKPIENANLLEFTKDVLFKSPSAASSVILNRSDNGRTSWKIKSTNETLGNWQDRVPSPSSTEE